MKRNCYFMIDEVTEETGENANENETDNGNEDEDDEAGGDNVEEEGEEEEEEQDAEATEEWLQKRRECPGEYHRWSLWSPCSETCGRGIKQRSRQRIDDSSSTPDDCIHQSVPCDAKISSCDITREEAEEICHEQPPIGNCNPADGSHSDQRVFYDPTANKCQVFSYTGCNSNVRNNFDTIETCKHVCFAIREGKDETFNGIQLGSQTTQEYRDGKVDCKHTDWSPWSHCKSCRGFSKQTRVILRKARNGGRRCPTKLERKKKCHRVLNCPPRNRSRRRRYREHKSVWEMDEVSVDCQLSHWSSWSPCNATCGNATQHRTRKVKVHPYGPAGKPCTRLVEFRKCAMVPCFYSFDE